MSVEYESMRRTQGAIDLARQVIEDKKDKCQGSTSFMDEDGSRIFKVEGILGEAEVAQFHERVADPVITSVSRNLITKTGVELTVETVLGEILSVNGLLQHPSTLSIQKPHNGTLDLWAGLTEGAAQLPIYMRRKLLALLAPGPRSLLVSNHFLDIKTATTTERDEHGNEQEVETEVSRTYRPGFRVQAQGSMVERDYAADFDSNTPWKESFDSQYAQYLQRVKYLGKLAKNRKQGSLLGMPKPPPESAFNAHHFEVSIIILRTIEKILKNGL